MLRPRGIEEEREESEEEEKILKFFQVIDMFDSS